MIYSNHALDIEQIQVLRGVIGEQTFCNGRATQIIYRLHFQKDDKLHQNWHWQADMDANSLQKLACRKIFTAPARSKFL